MKRIAIQDANILIDLIKANVFIPCMQLPYQFCTTDIIFAELYDEQASIVHPFILSQTFEIIAITEDDLKEIATLTGGQSQLSEQDYSAYYYAQKNGSLLLTGDKYLKEKALNAGLETHGILWLYDQLVLHDCISKATAIESLCLLMTKNKRLPIPECNLRLQEWADKGY